MNHSKMNNLTSAKPIIPLFFAVDEHYAPFLCVALRSLLDNASHDYIYHINILIDSLPRADMRRISAMQSDIAVIEFVNVGKKLDRIGSKLHLRDYYTRATYYRFFIPDLFPQYDRGLYLDCDIVVNGDISELFRIDLGDNLVAGAPEEVMEQVDVFGTYVEKVLCIPRHEYFSAGILLMNLAELRKINIEECFARILEARKYRVTQDQDYLNVLCRGRSMIFSSDWNKTAFPDAEPLPVPQIVHYKINWKPWHYKGTAYEEHFWKYAEEVGLTEELLAMRESFSQAQRDEEARQYDRLVQTALEDTAEAEAPGFIRPAELMQRLGISTAQPAF